MSGPRWPSPAVTRACLCSLIRLWVTSLITSWFLFSSCKIPYNVMSMQCQYISSNHYMCLQTLDNDVNIYMYMQHQLWLTFSDLWLFCFIMFLHMLSSCFRDGNTQAPYFKKKNTTIYTGKCNQRNNKRTSMFKNSEHILCSPIQTRTFLISSTHLMT